MKKTSILSSSILCAILIFTGCKKEEDNHEDDHHSGADTEAPVIQIQSPIPMKMYNNGDMVHINGTVSDASLHEMVIKILNDADNSELYRSEPTVHGETQYYFDVHWKLEVTDHTNASVIVQVEDHSSNVSADTVHIHIMP